VSLPSKLVEQRPDILAAEEQMHAASAAIGVAVANRLPQFTISAAYGGTATQFAQMFAHGNPFWSVAGNAMQTLFAGGTLLHQQRAAEAAFDQAAAQYRSTVITAFQNVANALPRSLWISRLSSSRPDTPTTSRSSARSKPISRR
jgi:outer membrane protein TolC